MARARNRLTARSVATFKDPGRYADGGGLYLRIDGSGENVSRRWVYRFTVAGKTREMGLGSFPKTSLADARGYRDDAEREIRNGLDPIRTREQERHASTTKTTFGACADAYIAAKETEWRNEKHRAQWRMTLEVYAREIRSKPVDEVTTGDILAVLQPIWKKKPETASRLRGRIEVVLDAARAKGLIEPNVANPARWRGHLDKLLPRPGKLSRGHHAAMPYEHLPEFMKRLRDRKTISARALEFLIFTAARSGEVREAEWNEIDLDAAVWVVPAGRMKAGREHRVPLSGLAVVVLKSLSEARVCDFVFPGASLTKPLSVMAMEMLLRRMDEDVTVHGFRSAFRDWAGNETEHSREVAEAALAHVVGDASERAYRRSDALEKRRKLMDDWAIFLE